MMAKSRNRFRVFRTEGLSVILIHAFAVLRVFVLKYLCASFFFFFFLRRMKITTVYTNVLGCSRFSGGHEKGFSERSVNLELTLLVLIWFSDMTISQQLS